MSASAKAPGAGEAVVLDNALLFCAANFRVRDQSQRMVRNVNLLGLAALADALVMHQRITVDREGWEYFADAVPQAWLPSIAPYVDIVDFALPEAAAVVDAVVTSPNSLLLGYALTVVDQTTQSEGGRDLNTNYFTYTGSDLGRDDQEQDLISLIQDRLEVAIPHMHLHLRNHDHVSALQCLVRGLQYQYYAAELGQAYVPHEFRGRVLNVLARDRIQPAFRRTWETLMRRVSDSIKTQYDEKLAWVRPDDDGSLALWERIQMPLFLTMALGRAKSADDLFRHVAVIRDKAFAMRQLLAGIADAESPEEAAERAHELRSVALEIDSPAPTKPGSIFSISAGLPATIALRMNLPAFGTKRSVSFIRDIYDNHALPLSLSEDVCRLFGCEIQPLSLDPLLDVAPAQNILDRWFARAQSREG